MNLVHKWKKILSLGCSHGVYADPAALGAVLKFKSIFKPDTTIHLGDAIDLGALRSGAKGTPDESRPLRPDIDGGIDFLERLEPTHYLFGNHEDRLLRLTNHHNEIMKMAATAVYDELKDTAKRLHCRIIPYDGIYQGLMIGGFRYMHGCWFNENAIRDHAEAFGNVVHAHIHRAGMAQGRRSDKPMGFCVGTLTRMENMDYAKTRRATLGWQAGFVYGYYTETKSQLYLTRTKRRSKRMAIANINL